MYHLRSHMSCPSHGGTLWRTPLYPCAICVLDMTLNMHHSTAGYETLNLYGSLSFARQRRVTNHAWPGMPLKENHVSVVAVCKTREAEVLSSLLCARYVGTTLMMEWCHQVG